MKTPIKDIAIVIGVGNGWDKAAENTAAAITENTGMKAVTLTSDPIGLANPSWLKCHLLDLFPGYDRYWAWDADLLPIGKWDPAKIYEAIGDRFAACLDFPSPEVERERFNYRLPENYINGGLLCFTPEHRRVFERTMRGHPAYGSWLEQTALNQAIQTELGEVALLPQRLNKLFFWMKGEPLHIPNEQAAGTLGIHVCSLGGNADALLRIQELTLPTLTPKQTAADQ
jgi:hypothetical protein